MRFGLLVSFTWLTGVALAQRTDAMFDQNCASCHEVGSTANPAKAPDRKAISKLTTEAIYASLTTGSMKDRAQSLTDPQKRRLAEFLGGLRKLGAVEAGVETGSAARMPNRCPDNPPLGDISSRPYWNGWSTDGTNTRFQPSANAGIAAADVPRLKLKWAFGLPGATHVYGQPSVVAGRVFVTADSGYVYSVSAASGCVYWSYLAEAAVRTAVVVAPVKGGDLAAFFGDLKGNEYAVNARTGAKLWTVQVEDHPLTRLTAAPKVYENRLYVPVASADEGSAAQPHYPCCTFRGSVVALDTSTGKQIWKTYTIPEKPKMVRKNSIGTQLWGPSGSGVWNSPTIDPKRKALYIGTGDAYTSPAAKSSDGLMAMDLATGKILWQVQDLAGDAWLVGCPEDAAKRPENCPKDMGPDHDFGASPILKELAGGKRVLIAGQKSGMVWAHDPDNNGAVVWKAPTGTSSSTGQIVWGGAADDSKAYFGLHTGGIVALQINNGERVWFTKIDPAVAPLPGNDGSVSAVAGAVFAGGWDGVLRVLATDTGKVLWEYNMVQEYKTVNGVPAKGGSTVAAGPTVVGGMVFVGSGYPGLGAGAGIPGNVLLAFGTE
ncbi:MAG: PQQ-binding-like beta-propeller repeat protein [Bryobacterales bacterium]|nr:PQQ-binding-like beta-propeller repeat protein [Bryobacterales bacterium]